MDPPVNRTKPILFSDLGADAFQRLGRALLAELREVRDAVVYGVNGQTQRGIDLEVALTTGRRWVVQCKACHQDVLKHVKAAVEDFLPYLDYWKAAKVEKFIVLVGCGVEDTKVHDAVRAYEEQFCTLGLTFELWDSSTIRHSLRGMRAVVEQFLPAWFADEICGSPSTALTVHSVEWRYSATPSALIAELETTHHDKIDRLRDLIRVGKEAAAEADLWSMQANASWEFLPSEIKARVLRLLAGIALDRRGEIERAGELLKKAKAVHPGGRYVLLETSILNRTHGAAAALAAMPDPVNKDEWHLQAALLINTGKMEEALQALLSPAFEADAETFRLRALAHLQRRELVQAKHAAAKANALAPEWALVRQAVALIEYFSAVSEVFEGWMHWQWPLPVDWYLVRSDAESRGALRRAGQLFAGLAADEETGGEAWQHAMGWQLATLANDSARQMEAAELSRQILAVQPTATVAIFWALARGYEFAREPSERALHHLCSLNQKSAEPVQTLLNLLVSRGELDEAATLLDAHKPLYEQTGIVESWYFQRGQLWVLKGEPDKAKALFEGQSDNIFHARFRNVFSRTTAKADRWTPELLASLREAAAGGASGSTLLEACEAHYTAGEFAYVVEHADELVRRVGTEACLRLALDAAALSSHFAECLGLMEKFRTLFRDGDFPPVVRRMRALCLRSLGRYIEAEQELRLLTSASDAVSGDRYALFQLQLDTGLATDASMTARALLDDPVITPEGLLHIADKLRSDHPELARTFVARAARRGVQTPQGAALGVKVGISLGLDDMVGEWMTKAVASAGQPDAPLKPFTIAQFRDAAGAK